MPTTLADASNSIKKSITLRCSLRIPPTLHVDKAKEMVKKILLSGDSTFGAVI